ncbi:MAG: PAS-domain containing protein, partial [Bradyrhizobium sp.]
MTAVRNDLQGAATNPAVIRSLDNVAIGFKVLSPVDRERLRSKYAGNVALSNDAAKGLSDFYGSAYGAMHPWFRKFAAEHGYDDVVFIDRDANVAYTLAKRSDFGTNVAKAGAAPTILTSIFERLKAAPDGPAIVTDFVSYGPAAAPVAFAATPVYQTLGNFTNFVGVLLFQVPETTIDQILNKGEGFGSRGEALIVGRDGLLRSNSRFGTKRDVLSTRFDDPSLIADGDSVRLAYTEGYRGQMIAAAAPFTQGDLRWSVIAADATEEVFKPVNRMVWSIVLACIVATLLLAAAAILLARRIARPVVQLVDRFSAALDNMPHGLCMFDADRRLILCNDEYRKMYELPPELTQAGTPLNRIFSHRIAAGNAPIDIPTYDRAVIVAASRGETAGARAELADGRTVLVMYKPIASGGYVATHQDVTEAIRATLQNVNRIVADNQESVKNSLRNLETFTGALARNSEKIDGVMLKVD